MALGVPFTALRSQEQALFLLDKMTLEGAFYGDDQFLQAACHTEEEHRCELIKHASWTFRPCASDLRLLTKVTGNLTKQPPGESQDIPAYQEKGWYTQGERRPCRLCWPQ